MVAGDVELVFASRNERSFKQIVNISMFCNQRKNLLEETPNKEPNQGLRNNYQESGSK